MRRMSMSMVVVAALVASACGDTDVADRSGELEPGQEVEDMGLERDVEPVDLDTLAWFTEDGTVTFDGYSWFVAGEPVWDPAVEYVGEYQGTPLYAEVGVIPPYDALYVPLEGDNWQLLERGSGTGADAASDTARVTEIR